MRKFHIVTTTEGCATNLLENATYRENLKLSGMANTSDAQEADILIVNSCGYTTEREEYTSNLIKELNEKYPRKKIIVGGCLPKINPKKLKEVHSGATFNPGDVAELNKILNTKQDNSSITESHFFDEQDFDDLSTSHRIALKARPIYFKTEKILNKKFQPLHNILKTTIVNNEYYSIPVSQGCMGKCTFCAIKAAKGEVKSKPISTIIDQFKNGLGQGHKKFWLVGDDIGCYGYDLGIDFADLLEKILEIKEDFELVINYFEPMWFIKLFDRMEILLCDKRILNINFPLQSGSFRIIKKMGREYDPQIVLDRIKKIKMKNPSLVMKTNIIVGFPGESYSDFFKSIKSIFIFDAILAIPYAARPGTGANKYKNHISKSTIKLRMILMNSILFIRHAFVAIYSILSFFFSRKTTLT